MKRISHYKTYNPHQFIYDKIELSEDFPSDKPDEECFKELLSRIEVLAKIAYPWLYQPEKTYIEALSSKAFEGVSEQVPQQWHTYGGVQVKASPLIGVPREVPEPEVEAKPLLQLIQESKSIKELQSWELLIKVEKDKDKRVEMRCAYDDVMTKLQSQLT